jgi:VWFA-related protein
LSRSCVRILQQFTNDKRLLNAAIDEIRFDSLKNGTFAFAPVGSSSKEQKFRDEANDEFVDNNSNNMGLLGLNFILRGMQDLPGRKSVLLLSDGFAVPTKAEYAATFMQSFRRVVDAANRSSVTINTMDVRGLVDTGFTAADDLTGMDGKEMLRSLVGRNQKVVDTQQGPRLLAEQTGGTSIVNNNDLSQGIRKILDDQGYYLVGYQPDDDTFIPKARPFHRLLVKVKRPGLKVRYRSGFFGVSDEAMEKPPLTSGQRLVTALISPFAVNEVSVHLNAIFNYDTKLGSHIQSLVHVGAKDIEFKDGSNGSKVAVFDVIAASIDESGFPVDTVNQSYTLTANNTVYKKYMTEGFVYGFTFPVKVAGTYQLRVALRDRGSDRIGSANQLVEVPDIGKKRLAVSGVYLESLSLEDWNRQNKIDVEYAPTNGLSDTSRRVFKRGSVLNYAFVIFNAKLDRTQRPSLTVKTKVFCDGKLMLESVPASVSLNGQVDMQRIGAGGSLNLGGGIPTGECVLQITVRDALAKEKEQTGTHFLQFSIIE